MGIRGPLCGIACFFVSGFLLAQVENPGVQSRKVMATLFRINKNLKETLTEKNKINMQLWQTEVAQQENLQNIKDLKEEIQLLKQKLKQSLRRAFELRNRSIISQFNSFDSGLSQQMQVDLLRRLNEKRLEQFDELKISQKRLEAKERSQQLALKKLVELKAKLTRKEQDYMAELGMKSHLLSWLRKKKVAENGGDAKVRLFEKQGQLDWPIASNNYIPFGLVDYKGSRVLNKGLFIESSGNSPEPVSAPFSGKVSAVAELDHLGKTIVIDHGDSYFTVYSNVSESLVAAGQTVWQGQRIAMSGSSDFWKKKGIYFEIRHFSEPVDPQPWMKGITQ